MDDRPRLTSMNVSLPATQKAYVQHQAQATGCSTPSEYVRRLIHADQEATAKADREAAILEGLGTPAREMTPGLWAEVRAALESRIAGTESS